MLLGVPWPQYPKAPVSLFLSFSLTSPWLTAPVAAGEAYHKLSY